MKSVTHRQSQDVNNVTPFISSFMNRFFKMMLYFKEVVFQFILQFKKYISNMHVSILNKTIVYRQYIFRIIFVTSSAALSCLPTSYRIAGERSETA